MYILKCHDGTFYTGYTPDLEARVKKHNAGKGAKYTRARLPVELVWFKEYKYFKKAFLEEIRIKRLRREQKVCLVSGLLLGSVERKCLNIRERLRNFGRTK